MIDLSLGDIFIPRRRTSRSAGCLDRKAASGLFHVPLLRILLDEGLHQLVAFGIVEDNNFDSSRLEILLPAHERLVLPAIRVSHYPQGRSKGGAPNDNSPDLV